jgi:hypothetical protein
MYNAFANAWANSLFGGYCDKDLQDQLDSFTMIETLDVEYHPEDPNLEEIDPKKKDLGEEVN